MGFEMKLGILGCKGTTLDLLNGIVARGDLDIDTVITISDKKAAANKVAFYQGDAIKDFCETNGLRRHVAKTYTLTGESDQAFFERERFDVLLVLGWERLLPDAVLKTLGQFACGMHGSAAGLPKGRGRSPMNWAILTQQTKFTTYLFRYTPGMDDGDVLGARTFDITPYDDIGTLHAKNRIAMSALAHLYLPKIADGSLVFVPQPDEKPTYYPKRTRADGFIDWDVHAEEVHRLVRAVAPPYPGALTLMDGKEVGILEGRPFDTALFDNGIAPGTIVDVSLSLNRIVVKTRNSAYLVQGFDAETTAAQFKVGDRFESRDGQAILADIRTRYPDFVKADEREI